jgi:hypothetical protein
MVDGVGPLKGKDSIQEITRQLCLLNDKDNGKTLFFQYYQHFALYCVADRMKNSEDVTKCSFEVMDMMKPNLGQNVRKCAEDAVQNSTNQVIAEMFAKLQGRIVRMTPSVMVNRMPFKVTLACPKITLALGEYEG